MGLFRKKKHAVAVYDSIPPAQKEEFQPLFFAVCQCTWVGPGRDSAEEALKDAYEHAPDNVSDETVHPDWSVQD